MNRSSASSVTMIAGAIVVALVVALMHSASAQMEKPKLDYENYCTGDWVNDWVYVGSVTVSNAVIGKLMTINYTTYVQKELKGSPYLTYSLWSSNRQIECNDYIYVPCTHFMCNATNEEAECTIAQGRYHDQLNVNVPSNTDYRVVIFGNQVWFLLEHFNQGRRLGCVKFPIHVYDPR